MIKLKKYHLVYLYIYWNSRREDIEEDHNSIFIEDTGAGLKNTY